MSGGEPWVAAAAAGSGDAAAAARHERDAFRELVRHVAYADTWLRGSDAFKLACLALGLEWDGRAKVLFEVRRVPVPAPSMDAENPRP